MEPTVNRGLARSAFWASAAFYALVALEFFYMVSPFAAYIYSVYGPGMDSMLQSSSTAWLISFFMPHIARETQSWFISWHEAIGMLILLFGLIAFLWGAWLIYGNKVRRSQQAVLQSLYAHVRHPQYLALMVAGFGMLLIWPRYLVLAAYVLVCFAYYWLARIEERICCERFSGYHDYMSRTGMFLPRILEASLHKVPWPQRTVPRVLANLLLPVVVLAAVLGGARALHVYSVNSVYHFATGDAVFISPGRISEEEIAVLADIALREQAVVDSLAHYRDTDARFINYVMPVDLWISEVPMYLPPGARTGHASPSAQDQRRYKIIFTLADFGPAPPARGSAILRHAINKTAIIEVWIDRQSGLVEQVYMPPDDAFYQGMPVPVF